MRLNKYIAQSTGMSRRQADDVISSGKVAINQRIAKLGTQVEADDIVLLDGKTIALPKNFTYVLVNKPIGFVSTRNSQDGSPTVYSLLPDKFHRLKYVGRLDKDSSGVLLMTDDGDFAHLMTHPSHSKSKEYIVTLDAPLSEAQLTEANKGVDLEDGPSKLDVTHRSDATYKVLMSEGRNRQIRRTFEVVGRKVVSLNRTKFDDYSLDELGEHQFIEVKKRDI